MDTRFRIRALWALAILLEGMPGAVAASPLGVQNWHADHGLPQNTVQALCQTRDGYLWVGTRFGLARFDGVRFRTFLPEGEHTEAADSISALSEGPDGTLWVGTLQGLQRLRFGRLERMPAPTGERVWAVWPESADRLWLGLSRGLGLLSGSHLEVLEILPGEAGANQVRSLAALGPDALLVTTLTSAHRFDLRTRSFSPWSLAEFPPSVSESSNAPAGSAWTLERWRGAGAGGFLRQVFELRTVVPTRNAWGPRIVGDDAQSWWVLDGRRRLYRVSADGADRWPPRSGGTLDEVLCVLRDRERGVWLGTVAYGLIRLQPPIFETIPMGVGDSDPVFSVSGDDSGAVWAGGRTHLLRIDREGATRHPLAVPGAPQSVTSVLPEAGGVWFGRDRAGLHRWDNGVLSDWSARAGLPANARVRALLRARDGALWIGSRDGLVRWVGAESRRFGTQEGLPRADVGAVHEDRLGGIWAGMDGGGVARWEGGRFRALTPSEGVKNPTVWGFLEDRTGALWMIGSGGVTRFQNDRFSTVTRAQGLFDDVNNQMFEDDAGHFWIGCNRGIYRVRTNELHAAADGKGKVNCVAFGVADGLAVAETNGENQPAGWRGPDGVLWFPSPVGVVRVDPASAPSNEMPPPVMIEEARTESLVLVDDSGRNPVLNRGGDALRIPPGNARVLEFHYTAGSFAAPERVRFRHRLIGHETAWVEAGVRRVAYYTNLRPGRYRFEVTACNNHGVWAVEPASLAFAVSPLWHQTPLFLAGLAAAVSAMAWGIHRLRVRFLERRLALEGQLGLAHERERIARDMHDDVGAGLTQIGLLALRAERAGPAEAPALIQRISDASRDAAQAMDEIVWAVNPRNDRLEPLADYFCQFAREYLEPTGIRCVLDMPPLLPDVTVPSDVRHHLLRVLKESLGNAVRHSGASEVRVILRFADGLLRLTVVDNGRGLSRAGSESGRILGGNGLRNLRLRMKSLGGKCTVEGPPGQGTRVEVSVRLEDMGSDRR